MSRIERPSDRPRRKKSIVEPPEVHVRELAALGQLMLGAAWADGDKHAVEIVAIAEQLKHFVDAPELPIYAAQRMEAFDPARFDVEAACAELRFDGDDDRLEVLRLVARVTGADQRMHPREVAYLERVAAAIGLDPKALSISLR